MQQNQNSIPITTFVQYNIDNPTDPESYKQLLVPDRAHDVRDFIRNNNNFLSSEEMKKLRNLTYLFYSIEQNKNNNLSEIVIPVLNSRSSDCNELNSLIEKIPMCHSIDDEKELMLSVLSCNNYKSIMNKLKNKDFSLKSDLFSLNNRISKCRSAIELNIFNISKTYDNLNLPIESANNLYKEVTIQDMSSKEKINKDINPINILLSFFDYLMK
jgi:hypothetical protein